MFMASMDHSPSEQIDHNTHYTTSLILSSNVEHHLFANDMAKELNVNTNKLVKWNKASRSYRKRLIKYFHNINRYSVFVFILSAERETILAREEYYLKSLAVFPFLSKRPNNRISFGPLSCITPSGEHNTITIETSFNRYIMCLHIAHFVLSCHNYIYLASQKKSNRLNISIEFQFFGDKFPGPPNEDMDQLFCSFLSLVRGGNITWGYFCKSDEVETDLLADNIAGAFNNIYKYNIDTVNFDEIPEKSPGYVVWFKL